MTKNPDGAVSVSVSPSGDKYDAIFGVLADQRRRLSLQYLLNSDTSVTVDELTTELAAHESQVPVTGPGSGGERDAIKVSLVHKHLPKMDEADVIEYDGPEQTISAASYSNEAREQFEAIRQ